MRQFWGLRTTTKQNGCESPGAATMRPSLFSVSTASGPPSRTWQGPPKKSPGAWEAPPRGAKASPSACNTPLPMAWAGGRELLVAAKGGMQSIPPGSVRGSFWDTLPEVYGSCELFCDRRFLLLRKTLWKELLKLSRILSKRCLWAEVVGMI